MSVTIPIPIAELEKEREEPSRTYRLDLERGRIYGAGSCDGLEAANQFMQKALLSPRFKCMIYDNQYGSEIKQMIASDVTQAYMETEMPRIIKDALLCDSRILDVYDFAFALEGECARVRFRANTIFGESVVQEVV